MDYLYCHELYHHGIKGQKWGIRRYQNPDGTLTEVGKKRYLKNMEIIDKAPGKILRRNLVTVGSGLTSVGAYLESVSTMPLEALTYAGSAQASAVEIGMAAINPALLGLSVGAAGLATAAALGAHHQKKKAKKAKQWNAKIDRNKWAAENGL